MKFVRELMIILLFSFLGEVLNYIIPLPIPASIYGMLLLFFALAMKLIKLEKVEKTAEFLLSIMLLFFIPAAVGIMDTFFAYKSDIFSIILVVIVSTIVVIISTGLSSQFVINFLSKKSKGGK